MFKFIKKRWQFIFLWLSCVAAFYVLASISYPITTQIKNFIFGLRINQVENGIETDKKTIFQDASTISRSPDLATFIQNRDTSSLSEKLNDYSKTYGINALVVTDKNGVALAREASPRKGDYIFQSTPYGQKVAEGESVVSIEQGSALPLIVIAGSPVKENGQIIGAIFDGYSVDDNYAKNFRAKYMNGSYNLLFYSNKDGVIGNTFEDPNTKKLLDAYFSVGSDFIQNSQSNLEVLIEGRSYFLKNLAFKGLQGNNVGGAIVFYPTNYTLQNAALTSVWVIVFVLLSYFLYLRWLSKKNRRRKYPELFFFALFLSAAIFMLNQSLLLKHLIVVQKPPYAIYNSTLEFSPDSAIFDGNFEQKLAVEVSSGGETINVAQVNLTYAPNMLNVTDVYTDNSFCGSGFLIQKEIDNQNGSVNIACGITSPGFSGNENLFQLGIQPLKAGQIMLHFASGTEVLANDGLGTNVLRLATDGSYKVVYPQTLLPVDGSLPAILAFSSSHPNSSRWYNKNQIIFDWYKTNGYQYVYALNNSPTLSYLKITGTATTSDRAEFNVAKDGVYYFHIAAEENGVMGPVSSYKIMVDTTPPSPPTIHLSQDTTITQGVVRMTFDSSDNLSGLQNNYYVKIDDGVLLPAASPILLSLPSGSHTVTVRAFDKAGNFSDNSSNTTIP